MKGLNKVALATAVAAAPFAAQAELSAMSDQAMGNTTGQAGVTIELDTQVSMDQIQYDQGADTGSVLMNNLDIAGVGGPGFDDGLDVTVDVDLAKDGESLSDYNQKIAAPGVGTGNDLDLNDGDALISVGNLKGDGAVDMNVNIGDGDATGELGDASNDGNAMQLADSDGDAQATLISDIDMNLFLSQLDIVARTDNKVGGDADSGSLEIETAFAIDNLDAQFDVASVNIQGMRMAGADSLGALKSTGAGSTADPTAINHAVVSMDIGQGDAVGISGEALNINLDNFTADIWMPEINVGSGDGTTASIGRVGIDNLNISQTEIAVYGRE
ncbi:DUF6160 family protein [Salicola sp. Rm-C-2C1-2]|uniref:DUF6160 family protein n=1 Tax=Salicola sp. Rm-C-2C1-2 TaxID=3141321 RepID=UPI0032E3CE41